MATLDTVKFDHLFSLFKGEPGTRKSTAALSYPLPQYWVSTDRKMDALIRPGKEWGVDFKQVHFDDYTDYNKVRTKLEHMQINCPFKTIIVDSVTSEGDIMNLGSIASKKGVKNKEGGEKGQVIGGIAVNDMSDYKAEAAGFTEMISLLKDIGSYHKVNIILIAHIIGARKVDDKASITHQSRIIVTGGQIISAKIPAYCSEVYHFNIVPSIDMDKEGGYGLFTTHTGQDFARTSLMLPSHFQFNSEPLYDKFIAPAIKKTEEFQPITRF